MEQVEPGVYRVVTEWFDFHGHQKSATQRFVDENGEVVLPRCFYPREGREAERATRH